MVKICREKEYIMKGLSHDFEGEAEEFDKVISKIVPFYYQMIDALVTSISSTPFSRKKILDLGCGTGNVSKRILQRYPHCSITCMDKSKNMIEVARFKLSPYPQIRFVLADFLHLDSSEQYDIIVSSLALHHLVTDNEKRWLYKIIYETLKLNGLFYNADFVLASNENLQNIYMNKWQKHMGKNMPQSKIENKILSKYYEEDRPAELIAQLNWLSEIGFTNIDVMWKCYNLAVYGGRKPGKA